MLCGSLDGHVKVFDLDTFKVTHASRYPGPILSLGLSPDCSLLAVGQADGLLSIRKHRQLKQVPVEQGGRAPKREHYRPRLTAANYRYFIRGQSEKPSADDFVVGHTTRTSLRAYDKLLKHFRYREALDAALLSDGGPAVVASVIEELAARSGLDAAVGGRDANGLLPLVTFAHRHISDPRHTKWLVGLTNRILDAYGGSIGEVPELDAKLEVLRERISIELGIQNELQAIQGMLEPILAAKLGFGAEASASTAEEDEAELEAAWQKLQLVQV
jgi:U3 small nucleolar RNA-associated protein 15